MSLEKRKGDLTDMSNNREGASRSAKMFCVGLVAFFGLIFVCGGIFMMHRYNGFKEKCTAVVNGTVEREVVGKVHADDLASPEYRYAAGKFNILINVEDDAVFRHKNIYAEINGRKAGDAISIYYSPDDPDLYYLSDRVDNDRTAAIFAFAAGGAMFVGAAFLLRLALKTPKDNGKVDLRKF